MNYRQSFSAKTSRAFIALLICAAVIPGDAVAYAASVPVRQQAPAADAPAPIPADQLDSLVAPIALYPDGLLAQVLAASTYPLEIVQLQQWLAKNPGLKDKALADAVEKQPWDPSVQALAALPDVVKRLADDLQWTTDLGNAFLAQQSDVMEAVQRMRKKAQEKGALKSNEQQKVETQVVESKSVIVIEQANPEVVYVPSYNPTVVYGAPVYPYPPIYYPPPGYYAAGMALSFGVGVAMGAFWGGGGGWGWNCGWGGNNVVINNNNNFIRNSNFNGGNRTNIGNGNRTNIGNGNRASTLPSAGGSSNWQHNPQHRGGAPYSDRATANKFGGTARGDSLANRQAGARQQINRQGGSLPSTRQNGGAGPGNRTGGGANTGAGANNRAGAGDRAAGGAGAGAGNRAGAGGADRVGNRDVSRSGAGNNGAFGGGSRGSRDYSGASARASSNRGSSSMRSGGGGARSGGGRRR